MAGVLQPWKEAQCEIEAACVLLIDPTPENLDRCSALLCRAIPRLSESRPPRAQAESLRASVQRVGKLLEIAGAYRRNWLKILQSMTAGCYTADRSLITLPTQARVSMEG